MRAPKKIEDFRKVLVVEGYSDRHFCAEFLAHLGRDNQVFIEILDGGGNLEKALTALLNRRLLAEKTHIGVLVDADENGHGTADRVARLFADLAGRVVVEGQWAEGAPDAKVGFFVAPSPGEVGEIEDLVWRTIADDPQKREETRCVETFLACMNAGQTAETRRVAKRKLGSWLAVKHEDDPRLGPAARDRKFDFDAPALARLKAFFNGF